MGWSLSELIAVAVAEILILVGWMLPLQNYLSPKKGLGYALGWTGAIMMTLLFAYSIRRRFNWSWLERTPSIRKWFNVHMLLGIFGPIAILYHCGYHLGALNSNVALWSMLVVFASGFIGKFLYLRVGWERLFRWWHFAHIPFVGILVLAAIAHIVSTFLYATPAS